jgi:hypothetical protein
MKKVNDVIYLRTEVVLNVKICDHSKHFTLTWRSQLTSSILTISNPNINLVFFLAQSLKEKNTTIVLRTWRPP